MTLSTTANKVSYLGDGATSSFSIPFLFLENAHIQAVLRNETGNETVWVLNTEYSLSGSGNAAGGTLTVLTSPTDYTPAAGETLVIRRVVPETQETDYPEGGGFPAAAHEQALDKLTMLTQQHSEEIARTLSLPVSSSLADIAVPEPGASGVIRWNESGTALEAASVGDLSLDIAAALESPVAGDSLVYDGVLWRNLPDGAANVRAFGATGDGAADDTAAFAAAVASVVNGGAIYVPDGTYLIGSGVAASAAAVTVSDDDTQIVLAPGATIKCQNMASGSAGIRISASRVRIMGGTIEGSWDMSGQGTASIANVTGDGAYLVQVQAQASADAADVSIEGVRFRRSSGMALRADTTSPHTSHFHNLTVIGCSFDENWNAMYFNNASLTSFSYGLTLDRVTVRETAGPAAATSDSNLGGNGVFTTGPFDGIRILNSRFVDVGRMGVEIWQAPGQTFTRNVLLQGCNFDYSQYRTLSCGAHGMTIRDNRIVSGALSSHWLELYGENITFEGNNVTGGGWFSTDDPMAGRNTKKGFVCRGNTFTDVTGQLRNGAVNFWNCVAPVVTDNHCAYSKAVGEATLYAVIDIRSSPGAVVENNTVDFASPCDRESAILFFATRDGRLSGNRVNFTGISNGDLYAPWNIGALQSCVVEGNRTNTDGVFTVTARGPMGSPASGTGMAEYKHGGSTFATTTAHSQVLNTPPGSPTNSLPYPVGDDPTGAWAQNSRSIATTSDGGSTWSFSDIMDVFVYRPDDAAWDTDHLPQDGSSGDTYLIAQSGFVDCDFVGNDFAHNNEIDGSVGTGFFVDDTINRGIVWNSRFADNTDQISFGSGANLVRASIRTRPAFAVPTTLNHEAGAIVPNANPSLSGIREWVCVSAGTPGTFHAVTIEDFKNKIVLEDDFIGPTLNSNKWTAITGSSATAATHSAIIRGYASVTSANINPGVTATSASGMVSSTQWRASNGGLVFETRAAINDVTTVTAFLGFTDTAALERPTESNGTTGQTPAATNCVGFLFDTDHNTDEWLAVGVKAGSGTTPVTCGAPSDNTYEVFRIEVDTSGHATFYIDDAEVAYVENAVSASTQMTPILIVMERAVAATRNLTADYLRVEMRR